MERHRPERGGGLVFYNSAGTPITGGSTSTPIAAYIQGDHATRTTSGFTDNKSSLDVYRPNAAQTPDVWSDFQLMGSAATYPNSSAPGALATSTLPVYTSKPTDSTLDDVIALFPNTSTTSGYGPNLYEVRVYTAANGHPRSLGYDWAEISVNPSAHTWSLVYSSAAASATTAPAAPTAVSATAGNASATVHWTAPTDNGGAAITGYQVEYSSNGGTSYTPFGTVASAASTSQTITGLTNGSSYLFKVAAINSVGTGAFSSASSAVTPTAPATAPAAPTAVTATAGNASATVHWTAPADNGGAAITGYQVEYSGNGGTSYTPFGTVASAASTSQTITGLTNGTAYLFKVAAINSVGTGAFSSPSAAVTPKAPTVPGMPTTVTATAGNASATVHWAAPADNGGAAITGYQVEYSGNGGTSYTAFGTVASAASTSQTITGLTNGTAYLFKVAAINSVGTGAFSPASASVTPTPNPVVPGAPTAVMATAGNATATVSWTAPADNGGAAIAAYQVQYSTDGGTTYVNVGSTTAGTSQKVTGLTNGKQYLFRVAAINSVGAGAYSSPSSAVKPLGTPTTLAIGGSSTIGYGSTARLGANLKANGTVLAGATVKLYGEPKGKSTFSYLGSAKTASTGSALLLPKPTATERYYWVFAGDTTHTGSTSSIRTVTVAQGVKVHITAGTLKSSYTEFVYGSFAPTGSGSVDLQIYRNGGWYRLESTTVHRQKMPNGSTYTGYLLKRRIFTKGTYRFRVYKPSTATLRYALSGTITIKVV